MKTSKSRINIYLLFILLVATILRLWMLGSIPPHLTQDEASFGYNAYSILKTGKDIHGVSFPLIFKSFGDFRPGLYFYLLIPFIKVLGLSEFSVRLPSAIAGVMGVWLIYKVVEIFQTTNQEEKDVKNKYKDLWSYAAAFFLAISPWHIILSRGAWEANVSLSLTLAGIYFFFRSFEKEKFLLTSSAFFALTLLTYQGAKLTTAIVFLTLVSLYWKKLFSFKKNTISTSLLVVLFLVSPILLSMFQGKTGRLDILSIFSYGRSAESLNQFLSQGGEKVGDTSYHLFHSEILNFFRAILGRWFNHFSGRFLFFEGDWENPRHSAPNCGMLLFVDLPLILLGLYDMLRKKLSRESFFILIWLILAPLPSILTRDQVHAVRAYNMVIPLIMTSSLGVVLFIKHVQKLQKRVLRIGSYFVLSILFLGSLIYFMDAYFVHLPKHNSKYWQYGYKQVVQTLLPIQSKYNGVIFQQSYDQPFIFFLFYGVVNKNPRYEPEIIQRQLVFEESEYGDVGLVKKLGNIHFENFSWPPPINLGNLVIGDNVSTLASIGDDNYNLLSEIKYPDGSVAFRILEKI
jgi:hypothetical protein